MVNVLRPMEKPWLRALSKNFSARALRERRMGNDLKLTNSEPKKLLLQVRSVQSRLLAPVLESAKSSAYGAGRFPPSVKFSAVGSLRRIASLLSDGSPTVANFRGGSCVRLTTSEPEMKRRY